MLSLPQNTKMREKLSDLVMDKNDVDTREVYSNSVNAEDFPQSTNQTFILSYLI